jgi:PDZ domain-containing protein
LPGGVWQAWRVTLEQLDAPPTPDGTGGARRPSTRHRWWAIPLACLGVLVAILPMVFSFVPSTTFVDKSRCTEFDTDVSPAVCVSRVDEAVEFALVPASAEPVEPRMEITGAPTYDTSGQIYFVTIREPNISMLDWFVTRDNDAARFFSHRDKYGDQTPQQLTQSGQQQMRSAKDNAMYVALKAAGYPVELQPGEVIIDYLLCLKANEAQTECLEYSPADELLDPGDVLTKVDGKPVKTVEDLAPIMKDIEPGASIEVEFTRNGEAMSGTIKTITAPGEDPARTIIGFRPIDTTTVKLPEGIDVEIDTNQIGGPSAGLAFTLTLIDELTEGDLMGGQKVAVTGTIDLDGNVGAIGGLNSKASAVQQVGVKYFLVPTNQGEDGLDGIAHAREVVGDDVEIIPVATLQEALDALVRIGGDPVRLVTTQA